MAPLASNDVTVGDDHDRMEPQSTIKTLEQRLLLPVIPSFASIINDNDELV